MLQFTRLDLSGLRIVQGDAGTLTGQIYIKAKSKGFHDSTIAASSAKLEVLYASSTLGIVTLPNTVIKPRETELSLKFELELDVYSHSVMALIRDYYTGSGEYKITFRSLDVDDHLACYFDGCTCYFRGLNGKLAMASNTGMVEKVVAHIGPASVVGSSVDVNFSFRKPFECPFTIMSLGVTARIKGRVLASVEKHIFAGGFEIMDNESAMSPEKDITANLRMNPITCLRELRGEEPRIDIDVTSATIKIGRVDLQGVNLTFKDVPVEVRAPFIGNIRKVTRFIPFFGA